MKKGKLLNSDVVSTLSRLGHTDQITISDAGLPIPDSVKRIDLAVVKNQPGFLLLLDAIIHEMIIEKVIIAEEIILQNQAIYNAIKDRFQDTEIVLVPHETFKSLTNQSKAVIRSGECTPFANIILQSGVDFDGGSHE